MKKSEISSGLSPATTASSEQPLDSQTEAQPAQCEPESQAEENAPAPPAAVMPQENGTEAPSGPAEPAPNTNADPGRETRKAKKPDKGASHGRKYVPSKKAMVDPLRLDMSKPLPLTSSQLSLQCIECHIIFSDHKSKERHLKLSHPAEYEHCILRNALFACYVCDRHFTNSTDLMVHQKAHTEKKPFKCPICGLAFSKSSGLTLHKKNHFGQDGYACTECGKLCKTMTLLKYHSRTHTGERPYVCKECGKRFTMSKALQKHMVSHTPEGAEGDGRTSTAKARVKKDNGAPAIKYPCSVCKATFKSTKTQLHHLKTKHNALPSAASNVIPVGQQMTPIITPISIPQTALLQVGPNGPLQKVDENIDTEPICRLIESLGNVQRVNQVVILGQVPPNAAPLEVQQFSHLAETMNLNLHPVQLELLGLKQTDAKIVEFDPSNNPCDPMEQTIILEPITPDGQLENPSFAELGSHMTPCENIELTLVQDVHTERPEGEVMHQILQQPHIGAIQSDPMDQIICQNEVEQDLEQTVILELIPTVELEESQTIPQNEIPSSSLVPTTDLETTADQTVLAEQDTSLTDPQLMTTVELELTSLQTEQVVLNSCPLVPPDTLTQTTSESESNLNEAVDSQISLDQEQPVMNGAAQQEPQETAEQKPSEPEPSEPHPSEPEPSEPHPSEPEPSGKLLVDSKESQDKMENITEAEEPPAKVEVPSRSETKQVPQMSELPVNVMSAQELVKVRKRKPTRAFVFQGYMQEMMGSIYNDDLQIDATPTKRQRTKKSHIVVKFGPQSKEKKGKKQKKTSQQHQPMQEERIRGKTPRTNLSEKKAPSQKKGRKGKKDKKVGHLISVAEVKSPSSRQDNQVQQTKGDKIKNKKKRQKEAARECVTSTSEHKTQPVFKKKKQTKIKRKDQPKNAKDGKRKKNLAKEEKVGTKTDSTSADISGPHLTQDALLLLKGHKQPQLKVYKLDPLKASGQTQEASTPEAQTTSQQSKDNDLNHSTSEATNNLTVGGKKKGGSAKKNQKALSLLSSLQVSRQAPESPAKPKTTRKRKSSPKVETEGVITSHSKRALECQDCGQRFSSVSSLQKHKTTVHIVESPGLTYTNGNIFEGVSRFAGTMSSATDWDTEPEITEMALEEREQNVSFPALIPSPSLSLPPSDVEVNACENNGKSKVKASAHTSPEVQSPSEQMKSIETPTIVTPQPPLSSCTQTKSSGKEEPLASDQDKQEDNPLKNSEVQFTTDEDVKEGLLLEVDLVTVGEQNEPTSPEDTVPQNESSGTCSPDSGSTDQLSEQVGNETTRKSLTSQTVSCSTRQVEIKEEEEEQLLIQKTKQGGTGTVWRNATSCRRRGTGLIGLKQEAISKRGSAVDSVSRTETLKAQDECQILYEERPISSESEINDDDETGSKTSQPEIHCEDDKAATPAASLPEKQVALELESIATSNKEVMNQRGLQGRGEHDSESPGITLEKFLAPKQSATADKEPCLMMNSPRQGLDSVDENEAPESQEVKVEENISYAPLVVPNGQNTQGTIASQQPHHHDIRNVLVKEEVQATHSSRHTRWNVEAVSPENTSSPLMESGETTRDEVCVTPEFNTNQCIFYPVKEEEREVPLGAVQTHSGNLATGVCSDTQQIEHQAAEDEGSHSAADYQEMRVRGLLAEPGVDDFAVGQADGEQHPPDLHNFLLQSSDEEDTAGLELSDPQLDSEAEVMANFYKNQQRSAWQPDEMSQNLPTSTRHYQAPRETNKREPINYFSSYFGWDTWVEIANCTNKLPNMANPVTAREVAQFVGIHIAMGTLKFPSPRLYWEDLTKVPLVSKAMPLSRFLELSRMLKLASPTKDPVSSNVQEGRYDCDIQNTLQDNSVSNKQSKTSQLSDGQRQRETANDPNSSKPQTDPLWKAQPLLCRFRAGCQSLRRQGDYAVDQYPLPLTAKMHNKKLSLYCTALIGYGGFLLHVDLKLGLSGKEDAVEKMVPKGSMVFLCKQELSTPAMLERLLLAGVHGAGRVGGARGQIGDEFVSSDGKLMLRRSHCGFILSTAGNGQRNMAVLIDNFEKAQMSAHLNRDLQNLYSIPLTASAPTCWPQAVLWYLTDLALVNSWLLYRQDHRAASPPLTLMAFRLEVSKSLIFSNGSDTQDSVPPKPPKERAHSTNETPNPTLVEESPLPDAATRYDGLGHWPEQIGEGEGGKCRFGDCQRTSRVLCLKCCVFLCISRNHNCFLNFHNQGSLGKE